MLRSDHTIYFDITQRCNIGCDFCMYANKRTGIELKLNQTGKDNIRNIFQRKDIKCISISGEGEPLNNQKIIFV